MFKNIVALTVVVLFAAVVGTFVCLVGSPDWVAPNRWASALMAMFCILFVTNLLGAGVVAFVFHHPKRPQPLLWQQLVWWMVFFWVPTAFALIVLNAVLGSFVFWHGFASALALGFIASVPGMVIIDRLTRTQ